MKFNTIYPLSVLLFLFVSCTKSELTESELTESEESLKLVNVNASQSLEIEVKSIISTSLNLNVPAHIISDEKSFVEDLDADENELANLKMAIKQKYGLEFPENTNTVGELVYYVYENRYHEENFRYFKGVEVGNYIVPMYFESHLFKWPGSNKYEVLKADNFHAYATNVDANTLFNFNFISGSFNKETKTLEWKGSITIYHNDELKAEKILTLKLKLDWGNSVKSEEVKLSSDEEKDVDETGSGDLTVEEKVKIIVATELSTSVDLIVNEGLLIDDYGADDLDIMDIILSVEAEFDIEIPDDKIEVIALSNVGYLVDFVIETLSGPINPEITEDQIYGVMSLIVEDITGDDFNKEHYIYADLDFGDVELIDLLGGLEDEFDFDFLFYDSDYFYDFLMTSDYTLETLCDYTLTIVNQD